jgi:hypothetical protein
MLPLTTYMRRTRDNPAVWENFEYPTLLARRFHANPERIREGNLGCPKTIR